MVNKRYEGIVDEKLTVCRDYSAILEWSVEKSQELSSDEWTDYTITDPGVIALSMISYLFDHVNYEIDALFLNNLIRYTKSYDILMLMASFMGIEVPFVETSEAKIRIFTVDGSNGISLPANYRFRVRDRSIGRDLLYNIRDSVVSGSNSVEVNCIEGEYDSVVLDPFNNSQMDSYNRSFFPNVNTAGNIVWVSSFHSDNPNVKTSWVKTDNAFLAVKDLMQFSIHRQGSDRVYLRFIPGVLGELTSMNHNRFLIEMYSSSGSLGRPGVGSILLPHDPVIVSGNDVTSNIQAEVLSSWGGRNSLSLEELRRFIGSRGNEVFSNVTNDDYKRISSIDSRILKTVASPISGEAISIYYLTDQHYSVEVRNEIEEKIENHLEGRMPLFTSLPSSKGYTLNYIDSGDFIKVNPSNQIIMEVYLKNNEVDTEAISLIINNYIDRVYDRSMVEFGVNFRRFILRREIESLHESISHVFITNPSDDVQVPWNRVLGKPSTSISYKSSKIVIGDDF